MPRVLATFAALGMLLAGPALAQTQPQAQATAPSPPMAPLPAPALDDNAPPQAFIQAAIHAIAAGRAGEAQEAIERAESRALDRSVKPSLARDPSQQPLVQQLSQARQALASGDRLRAVTLLQAAAQNKEATEK